MKDAKGHGSNARGVHAVGIATLPTKQAVQRTGIYETTGRNAHELRLFGDNDGNLYRQSQQPIEKNLLAKAAKGIYDHALATKLWGYHADRAAQAYHKQFGSPGTTWHGMFSTADRRSAAVSWANSFRSEHKL